MNNSDKTTTALPGSYMILNLITNARYVGSAARKIVVRFTEHRSALCRGGHRNPHLQSAWLKHGEDAFRFIPLENTDPKDATASEQKWFDLFRAAGVPLYNAREDVKSQLGYKHTSEAKEKIRQAHSGKQHKMSAEGKTNIRLAAQQRLLGPRNQRKNSRPFEVINPSGKTILGQNLLDLCNKNDLDPSAMTRVIKGKAKSYKGWTAPDARKKYLSVHPLTRTANTFKACETCGKEFQVTPSAYRRRKFCSKSCRAVSDQKKYSGDGNPNFKHGGRMAGIKRIHR